METNSPPTWEAHLGKDEYFRDAWLHPDGRRLLLVTVDRHRTGIRLLDLQTGTLTEPVLLPRHTYPMTIDVLVHSTQPSVVWIVRSHGSWRPVEDHVLLDLTTMEAVLHGEGREIPSWIQGVSTDGAVIVGGGYEEVQWFRALPSELRSTAASWHARKRRSNVDLDPTGRWLVQCFEGRFIIHDLRERSVRRRRWYYGRSLRAIDIAPDGRSFHALGSAGRELCVFSLPGGRLLRRWTFHERMSSVFCEADGEHLILAEERRPSVRILRFDSRRERGALVVTRQFTKFTSWSWPSVRLFEGWAVVAEQGFLGAFDLRDAPLEEEVTTHSRAPLQGKVFVISGAFGSVEKAHLRRDLRSGGASVVGSISHRTTAVLLGGTAETKKSRRARTMGIPVIGEAGLADALWLGYGCDPSRQWAILRTLVDCPPGAFLLEHIFAHLRQWPIGAREGVAEYVEQGLACWPQMLRRDGLERLAQWARALR